MTALALMCALATVLLLVARFPLVPSVPFLTYDPKDIVIGMAGFLFGPWSAAIVSMISSGLELFLRGGNLIDWLMNVLSSCAFVVPAAVVYQKMHSKNGAFIGLLAGGAAQVIVMVIWNYVMDPIYFGMAREAVVSMLPAIALFNVLKCMINASILLLIYKPISNALKRSGMIPKRDVEIVSEKKSLALSGTFILITACIVLLAWANMI